MSLELQTWLVNTLIADSKIIAMVGADTSGVPAIFPYHHSDADERIPFPHITFARFGSKRTMNAFQEQKQSGLTTQYDDPQFAICVWSTNSVDECWRVYRLIDGHLRGPGNNIANQYFSSWSCHRTTLRDDLFDKDVNAFHLHSEYCATIQTTPGVLQP
jgi:hypothetical protein